VPPTARKLAAGPCTRAVPAPLVVTLLVEDAAQERFDRLRAEHIPAGRNHLAAHGRGVAGRRLTPAAVGAVGLGLWRYLGGPWEKVARYPFG
jgi:hypothetical protein